MKPMRTGGLKTQKSCIRYSSYTKSRHQLRECCCRTHMIPFLKAYGVLIRNNNKHEEMG